MNVKTYVQRIGGALQIPISVLPAAALMVGIGHWLPESWAVSVFLQNAGTAILNNIALLFAVGLSFGMSKVKDGSAALTGLVAYLIPTFLLAPDQVATLIGVKVAAVDPAFAKLPGNVFIGLSVGLIAAVINNRFRDTKLPSGLAFFSGRRLPPIIVAAVMLLYSLVMYLIWPPIYGALVAFGRTIVGLGPVGAGLYGLVNRLLIPTGLHQALNSVFWFDVAGVNDLGKFWASTGTKGITGMFMAGFFPIMMFGLPAAAFAIYRNARPERKKEVKSQMLGVGFASCFTGVTEPLEFTFIFTAWPLWIIHAVLTGLSLAFAAFMHWTAGFTFSAGLVDYTLSFRMPLANQPYMLLIQGVVMAILYYFIFNFAIKKWDLHTPGRETDDALAAEGEAPAQNVVVDQSDDEGTIEAKKIYAAVGGYDNLTDVDSCTTRLRLQVVDSEKIDVAAIKAAGAPGVSLPDKTHAQIVIGANVQFVAEPFTRLFNSKANVAIAPASSSQQPVVGSTNGTGSQEAANVSATEILHSIADGSLLAITEVPDDTFASKLVGDGFGLRPSATGHYDVLSPVNGEITMVASQKHGIGIRTDTGLELLVHIGIDTVQLNGTPFDIPVIVGKSIHQGEVIAHVDNAAITAAGKDTTIVVVATNTARIASVAVYGPLPRTVSAGEPVGRVDLK